MQRGNLEMAMISAFDIAKQVPEWSIFTAGYLHPRSRAPGEGVRRRDRQGDVQARRGQDGHQGPDASAISERAKLNLRTEKEIKTPADLAGVKLRMPGSDTWLFLGKALGANPLPVAFGEIYTALQTGAIDGQDNPLPTVRAAKFYEVTKQIVMTDHLVELDLPGAGRLDLEQARRQAEEPR